eukprot:CAMPEP_0114401588 /NCGR_PEP_ID=MMETSP0102-20121206/17334_1 /TAXON_ID=38822 ORGANISM="Pteridomonas danica, Strain PT" /NCGR_SAMPLE_ID=MMETSP0102 /ASSEMBLY_ACC=CAM_ASM_000212 /LENGTH=253 /DNA_ID=CAMNT_0001564689 /DNA_START=21 /DNA_END=779 /DNA_ORIENTATION=+
MSNFVLLQVSSSQSLKDSVIEMSPNQIACLDFPAVVRVEKMIKTKKKPTKTFCSLICEVQENETLIDDHAHLGLQTMKVIKTPENECIRISLVERLKPYNPTDGGEDNKWTQLQKRENIVIELQQTLEKLTYEKSWYQAQAEKYRSELATAMEELDLAMEERQVAVSMYTKSRMVEQELLGLKIRQIQDSTVMEENSETRNKKHEIENQSECASKAMDILRDLSIDLSICHVDITQGLQNTAAGLQIALASSA